MANDESWFTKWLRNGRLSGLTFATVLIAYIVFSVMKLPTETFSTLLLLAGGVFIGNLAIRKDQDEKSLKSELRELKKKVEENDSTTD